IAVILRHVWLSAHHRTETFGSWTIGSQTGQAETTAIGNVISHVYSGNVSNMVAPYADSQGHPLRSWAELRNLLNPGDILVWEHHEHRSTDPGSPLGARTA